MEMQKVISRAAGRYVLGGMAAACLLLAAPLAPASNAHALTVKYSDLNLSTAAGASALYERIKGAARFVCGEEGRTLFEQRMWGACYQRAISSAAESVHSPLLSTLVRGAQKPPRTAALTR